MIDSSRKDRGMAKTVKIKMGAFKGYMDIVKSASDNKLMVELQACKDKDSQCEKIVG